MSSSLHPPQHFGARATIAPTSWMLKPKPKDETLKKVGFHIRKQQGQHLPPGSLSPRGLLTPTPHGLPTKDTSRAAEELRGATA